MKCIKKLKYNSIKINYNIPKIMEIYNIINF